MEQKPSIVFILRTRIDWHNTDSTDITVGYYSKEQAHSALNKEIKKFKNSKKHEVEVEHIEDGYARIYTTAEDYAYFWVEPIAIH